MTIRPAIEADLGALNDLYNQYVEDTHITFDLEPVSIEARREWFTHYGVSGRHRLLAAFERGELIGFASSSRFRPKPGYDTSVETSIYLAPDATGMGVGIVGTQRLVDAFDIRSTPGQGTVVTLQKSVPMRAIAGGAADIARIAGRLASLQHLPQAVEVEHQNHELLAALAELAQRRAAAQGVAFDETAAA